MANTFPRELPNLTDIAAITIRQATVVGRYEAPFTLTQQIQKHQGQRWEIDITLVPMSRAKADVWLAWVTSLNGREKTFLGILSPDIAQKGVASASSAPLVNGQNQTGNSLIIDGAPTSTSNYLKAGDFIQLGAADSTARLYMVLEDVATDSGGNATFDIWPDLYASPADDATVTVSNPKGLFRLKDNVWDALITGAGNTSGTVYRQIRFSGIGVV